MLDALVGVGSEGVDWWVGKRVEWSAGQGRGLCWYSSPLRCMQPAAAAARLYLSVFLSVFFLSFLSVSLFVSLFACSPLAPSRGPFYSIVVSNAWRHAFFNRPSLFVFRRWVKARGFNLNFVAFFFHHGNEGET